MRYLIITILIIVNLLISMGCNSKSKIEIPIAGDGVKTLEGKAADDYVKTMSANEMTSQGRASQIIGSLKHTTPILVLLMVGGFIFWGITRSKFGWVIPASAIGGIVLIMTFAQWSTYITGAVIVIAVALLIWKAKEYQAERNAHIIDKIIEK